MILEKGRIYRGLEKDTRFTFVVDSTNSKETVIEYTLEGYPGRSHVLRCSTQEVLDFIRDYEIHVNSPLAKALE
jgi:hypothetical protein